MNLRREFENILEAYGNQVIVAHQREHVTCSCYDSKTMSADRACPICLGIGKVPRMRVHTTRETDASVPESLPGINQPISFGELAIGTRAYYFRYDSGLREKDLIFDVAWRNGYPVWREGGIYEVSHVDPARFEKGELIFLKVYVKDTPIDKRVRGFNMRRLADGLQIEPRLEEGS